MGLNSLWIFPTGFDVDGKPSPIALLVDYLPIKLIGEALKGGHPN